MIGQGAVKFDGKTLTEDRYAFTPGTTIVLQCGKRKFVKLVVR